MEWKYSEDMSKKDNKLERIAKVVKEMGKGIDIEACDESYYSIVYKFFCSIEDSRQQTKVIYKIGDIITIVFFCVLAGIDESG